LDDVTAIHHTDDAFEASELGPSVDELGQELGDAFHKRSEADWEFVAGQIEEAYRAGRVLDDQFVETLARQRFERAKAYGYADRPDAGPTFESSLSIVRSILNIHLTALRQYEAESEGADKKSDIPPMPGGASSRDA